MSGDESLLAIEPSSGKILLEYDEKNYLDLSFPTGSLIKVFTVMAALKQKPSWKDFRTTCRPSRWSSNSFAACWYRPGHGEIGMIEALAQSCNWYLRELAKKVKPAIFWETLAEFSLIEKNRVAEYLRWSTQDTLEAMVGTGSLLKIPPRRLLYAFCALFNGGYVFTPAGSGPAASFYRVKINPDIIKILQEGMKRCWTEGSGRAGQISSGELTIAGKTGTSAYYCSSDTGSWRTHGLFAGFFPPEGLPKVGILVFCFSGDGKRAAEIAGEVLAVLGKLSR